MGGSLFGDTATVAPGAVEPPRWRLAPASPPCEGLPALLGPRPCASGPAALPSAPIRLRKTGRISTFFVHSARAGSLTFALSPWKASRDVNARIELAWGLPPQAHTSGKTRQGRVNLANCDV